MSRVMRWGVIPAVLVVLTVGTAQAWPAVPARSMRAAPEVAGVLDAAWNWLASLLRLAEPEPAGLAPSSTQEKDGCGSDPWGNPINCG